MRKVVVTGIGVVAAPGVGMDDLWKGMQHPPSAPGSQLVANWDPEPWLPRREHRRLDRFTQFALVAAHEALEQAGPLDVDPNRVTVSVATGIGGLGSLEELVHVADEDEPRASPFLIPMMMTNAAAAGISIKYGFGGQVSDAFRGLRRRNPGRTRRAPSDPMGICRRSGGWRHRGSGPPVRRGGVQGGQGSVTERDRPPVRRRPRRVRHG